jgi:hypothetical protein
MKEISNVTGCYISREWKFEAQHGIKSKQAYVFYLSISVKLSHILHIFFKQNINKEGYVRTIRPNMFQDLLSLLGQ